MFFSSLMFKHKHICAMISILQFKVFMNTIHTIFLIKLLIIISFQLTCAPYYRFSKQLHSFIYSQLTKPIYFLRHFGAQNLKQIIATLSLSILQSYRSDCIWFGPMLKKNIDDVSMALLSSLVQRGVSILKSVVVSTFKNIRGQKSYSRFILIFSRFYKSINHSDVSCFHQVANINNQSYGFFMQH